MGYKESINAAKITIGNLKSTSEPINSLITRTLQLSENESLEDFDTLMHLIEQWVIKAIENEEITDELHLCNAVTEALGACADAWLLNHELTPEEIQHPQSKLNDPRFKKLVNMIFNDEKTKCVFIKDKCVLFHLIAVLFIRAGFDIGKCILEQNSFDEQLSILTNKMFPKEEGGDKPFLEDDAPKITHPSFKDIWKNYCMIRNNERYLVGILRNPSSQEYKNIIDKEVIVNLEFNKDNSIRIVYSKNYSAYDAILESRVTLRLAEPLAEGLNEYKTDSNGNISAHDRTYILQAHIEDIIHFAESSGNQELKMRYSRNSGFIQTIAAANNDQLIDIILREIEYLNSIFQSPGESCKEFLNSISSGLSSLLIILPLTNVSNIEESNSLACVLREQFNISKEMENAWSATQPLTDLIKNIYKNISDLTKIRTLRIGDDNVVSYEKYNDLLRFVFDLQRSLINDAIENPNLCKDLHNKKSVIYQVSENFKNKLMGQPARLAPCDLKDYLSLLSLNTNDSAMRLNAAIVGLCIGGMVALALVGVQCSSAHASLFALSAALTHISFAITSLSAGTALVSGVVAYSYMQHQNQNRMPCTKAFVESARHISQPSI